MHNELCGALRKVIRVPCLVVSLRVYRTSIRPGLQPMEESGIIKLCDMTSGTNVHRSSLSYCVSDLEVEAEECQTGTTCSLFICTAPILVRDHPYLSLRRYSIKGLLTTDDRRFLLVDFIHLSFHNV